MRCFGKGKIPLAAPRHILKLSCTDTTGIVAAVTDFLARHNALLSEASHFVERTQQKSFVRLVFADNGRGMPSLPELESDFRGAVAQRFGMQFAFYPQAARCRVLIAVSRQGHCLNALLNRWRDGHLPIDVVGVVSNHEAQRELCEWHKVPFHYLPIVDGDKPAQEAKILTQFEQTRSDLLVLARYMQILTPHACDMLAGKAINIHHSFLPGFKGARPYHQAYVRGVKIIGATAHYVTEDLDEGPIIEQAVERVDHTHSARDLERLGSDIEAVVLNRAVQWHAEHRVFRCGNRTIVLRS